MSRRCRLRSCLDWLRMLLLGMEIFTRVGFGKGFFRDREFFILGQIEKSRKSRNPGDSIRDFSQFRDFYPRDFHEIPGIRDFFGNFYLRDILSPGQGFSSWDRISHLKHFPFPENFSRFPNLFPQAILSPRIQPKFKAPIFKSSFSQLLIQNFRFSLGIKIETYLWLGKKVTSSLRKSLTESGEISFYSEIYGFIEVAEY